MLILITRLSQSNHVLLSYIFLPEGLLFETKLSQDQKGFLKREPSLQGVALSTKEV